MYSTGLTISVGAKIASIIPLSTNLNSSTISKVLLIPLLDSPDTQAINDAFRYILGSLS